MASSRFVALMCWEHERLRGEAGDADPARLGAGMGLAGPVGAVGRLVEDAGAAGAGVDVVGLEIVGLADGLDHADGEAHPADGAGAVVHGRGEDMVVLEEAPHELARRRGEAIGKQFNVVGKALKVRAVAGRLVFVQDKDEFLQLQKVIN